jgi:hypothetical protein
MQKKSIGDDGTGPIRLDRPAARPLESATLHRVDEPNVATLSIGTAELKSLEKPT